MVQGFEVRLLRVDTSGSTRGVAGLIPGIVCLKACSDRLLTRRLLLRLVHLYCRLGFNLRFCTRSK